MKVLQVKRNRVPVEIHEISVSAYPINRIWPGYQRNPDQTEPAWFVAFDMEQPVVLEVEYDSPVPDDLEIRPLEYKMRPEKISPRKIRIVLESPRHFTLGKPDGHDVLHVFADEAFHYCAQADDLYFGPGIHHAGVIMPRSGQTVCIDSGAIVYGMIFCYRCDDVKIVGHGILDSSQLKCPKENQPDQPGGELLRVCRELGLGFPELYVGGNVVIWQCERVELTGIILVDAPSWSVTVRNHCRNVRIDNLKIVGQWRYNSDGIDICASSDVTIRNCFIRTFDDCVVMRAPFLAGESEPVRNVTVERCILWCDWGKSLEIWCGEKECAVEKIEFRDLFLIRVQNIGISITTTYGSSDTLVQDIRYSNIFIDTDEFYPEPICQQGEPTVIPDVPVPFEPYSIAITRGFLGHDTGNQGIEMAADLSGYRLVYRNLRFERIRCSGRKLPVKFEADDALHVSGVVLNRVDYNRLELLGEVHDFRVDPSGIAEADGTARRIPDSGDGNGKESDCATMNFPHN